MKKHITAHVIFAATAMASQQAWALGFGRVVSDAVLGEPLAFTVPVRVEPGERFGGDCVSVEVYYGESRLTSNMVRVAVSPGTSDTEWLVRISTSAVIAEPIVEVALSAGCSERFLRRFTVFADPPVIAAASVAPVRTPSAAPAALAPRDNAPAATGRPASGRASAPPAADRPRATHRKGPTMALANELNAPPSPPRRHVPVATPQASAPDNARKPAPAVAAAPADAARLVLDGGYAHLKLDIEEPIIPPAATASGAGVGLSSLDDPDTKQLRMLEENIQAMKRSEQAHRDETAKLQAQLAEARSQSHDGWLPWLLALLAVAVAAAAALAWKLRQQARYAHSAWFNESQGGDRKPAEPVVAISPTIDMSASTHQDSLPSVAGEVVSEQPEPDVVEEPRSAAASDQSATQAFDRSTLAPVLDAAAAPRELSVEELLDLEQQADFFIALGQEDAAVDLLMSHLRSAGGQSPLPYTKLLEIYRRQGDRSAYERTRARFNRRFNAYAPDWDTGPTAGRVLEDYPETVALVQAAWASPIDAMAVLEGLLFKRDDTSELFDLPAYRDVLVLYSLARDLWQQGAGSMSTQVDVLLPLDGADDAAPDAAASDSGDLDLPLDVSGFPTSYELTSEFVPTGLSGGLDLEIPNLPEPRVDERPAGNGRDDDVHVTLDAFSLAPIEPTKPPPSPLDWDAPEPPKKH